MLLLALAQVTATMAAPWLIGVAIDDSLPDARRGDYTSLERGRRGAGRGRAAVGLAALGVRDPQRACSARQILYDLRRRGFDHVQALSVSFHERFTSGRVISRLTSDVDTLHRAARHRVWTGCSPRCSTASAIAVLLVVLDLPLALIALGALVPLWLLYRWFSPARGRGVQPHPRDGRDA